MDADALRHADSVNAEERVRLRFMVSHPNGKKRREGRTPTIGRIDNTQVTDTYDGLNVQDRQHKRANSTELAQILPSASPVGTSG
jgi:hypothetical protein